MECNSLYNIMNSRSRMSPKKKHQKKKHQHSRSSRSVLDSRLQKTYPHLLYFTSLSNPSRGNLVRPCTPSLAHPPKTHHTESKQRLPTPYVVFQSLLGPRASTLLILKHTPACEGSYGSRKRFRVVQSLMEMSRLLRARASWSDSSIEGGGS